MDEQMISTRNKAPVEYDQKDLVSLDRDWLIGHDKKILDATNLIDAASRIFTNAAAHDRQVRPTELGVINALLKRAHKLLVEAATPW
jgi:hypothetical protein